MKFLIVLALVAAALARPDDTYNSKYDNFNIDELIGNERLLKSYAHCFIGDGKCTSEGSDVKSIMPEAIASSCAKCTERQKVIAAKTIKAMKAKLPTEYETLTKNNDPEGKYSAALAEFLAKYAA